MFLTKKQGGINYLKKHYNIHTLKKYNIDFNVLINQHK